MSLKSKTQLDYELRNNLAADFYNDFATTTLRGSQYPAVKQGKHPETARINYAVKNAFLGRVYGFFVKLWIFEKEVSHSLRLRRAFIKKKSCRY